MGYSYTDHLALAGQQFVSALPERSLSEVTPATVQKDISTLLLEFVAAQREAGKALDDDYAQLWDSIGAVVTAGGKRLRPYLAIITYLGLGGTNYGDALLVAAAHELLHTALLMHDDIIDHDYVRHGQDNVAGQYRKTYKRYPLPANIDHYADSAALLAGDLCLTGANDLVAASNFTAEQKLNCQRLLNYSMFVVASGELLDTEAAMRPVDQVQPAKIADQKTASYSCIGPLVSGGYLADAPQAELHKLEGLGRLLGIAYQYVDDILGMFGDPSVTGKPDITDLREGKRTHLIQSALKLASAAEQKDILSALGNPKLTDSQADEIRRVIEQSGARAAVEQEVTELTQQAQTIIGDLPLQDYAKTSLNELVDMLTRRQA